jgi:hypothetical protein
MWPKTRGLVPRKIENYRLLPRATATVLRKLERRQYLTDAAILLAVILNAAAVFLVGNKFLDNFQGLVGNLVASGIGRATSLAKSPRLHWRMSSVTRLNKPTAGVTRWRSAPS